MRVVIETDTRKLREIGHLYLLATPKADSWTIKLAALPNSYIPVVAPLGRLTVWAGYEPCSCMIRAWQHRTCR